jgi:hypothetical protein
MEDADIEGICTLDDFSRSRRYWCDRQKPLNNGWTEITPDNVDEVSKEDPLRLMIATFDKYKDPQYMEYCEMLSDFPEMAKKGGYFYYVLPELKIE